MSEKRLLGVLGLAARAGALISGQEACLKAVRSGKVQLLLLDGSASGRTIRTFQDACRRCGVPCIVLEQADVLGPSIGRPAGKIAGIAEEGFAAKALSEWENKSRGGKVEQD